MKVVISNKYAKHTKINERYILLPSSDMEIAFLQLNSYGPVFFILFDTKYVQYRVPAQGVNKWWKNNNVLHGVIT